MVFATPSQRGHTFFDMTPNVRCSSRDLVIKFYFKTTALSFKRECVRGCRLCRFGCEATGALPLGESVAGGGEHLRLWRGDPSGDIRELGGSLAASLLLAKRPAPRRAGGTRTGPASLTSFRSPRSCVRSSPTRDVRSLRSLPVLNRACRACRDIYHKHIPYIVFYPPLSDHLLSARRSVNFLLIIKFLFWTFLCGIYGPLDLRLYTWLVGILQFCWSVQIKDCLDCGKGKTSV